MTPTIDYTKPIYVAHVYSNPDPEHGYSGWHEYGCSNNIYSARAFIDQFVDPYNMFGDMICVRANNERELHEIVYRECGYNNLHCDNIIDVIPISDGRYLYTTGRMYQSDIANACESLEYMMIDAAVSCMRLKMMIGYLRVNIPEIVPLLELVYRKYIMRWYCMDNIDALEELTVNCRKNLELTDATIDDVVDFDVMIYRYYYQ